MQYIAFCDCLLSLGVIFWRFTVVQLHFYLLPNNTPLWHSHFTCPLLGWGTPERLLSFGHYEQGCHDHMCAVFVCTYTLTSLWYKTQEGVPGSHGNSRFSLLRRTGRTIPHSHQQCERLTSPHRPPCLLCCLLFSLPPSQCACPSVVLIHVSMMAHDTQHPFIGVLPLYLLS